MKKPFLKLISLVPEEDPIEGWNMYQWTIKQNQNFSVIGGCDCKNLTFTDSAVVSAN